MLLVRPFKQSRSMCGPASLKITLQYFGVEKTERALARLSGATRKNGVPGEGIVRAAQTLGFQARIKDRCTITDIRHEVLERAIPVIVDWFLEDDGHYSVVVGIDQRTITLQDPSIGHRRVMDLTTFQRL